MAKLNLKDISLKVIDMSKSHTSFGQQSKDNFMEIETYINNLRCRISGLEGTTPTVTTNIIKNVVRSEMIKTVDLKVTHVDGTTVSQDGFSVTRSGNDFIIQTPDSVSSLLHNLRITSSKLYATGYDISMDTSNQLTIHFATYIKEDLELLVFG